MYTYAARQISDMTRPAVFLDRDGTLNVDVDYLRCPEQLELLPGTEQALADLSQAGFALVVVTNQSGIARGYLGEDTLEEIHASLERKLSLAGVQLSGIEYCPHLPESEHPAFGRTCSCRKPSPGMLLRAAERLNLDLGRSWMIGDSERDLEAGRAAGVRPILVRTGKGEGELEKILSARGEVGLVAADLSEAAQIILES